MPPLWLIKAGVVIAVLLGVWFHGRHAGATSVQSDWDAERQAQAEAAEAQRESNRLRARAAETTYEAQRSARARAAATPPPEYAHALTAPICPIGDTLQFGDVPVPGAALDRLRHAGADY